MSMTRRLGTVTGLSVLLLAASAAAAQADTTGNWYYLQGVINGGPATYAHFGNATDTVLVGDWDGDGRDTLMIRRGNDFYVSNSPAGGATAYSFKYGSPGDIVLIGDWNGDGRDTLGVRRGNDYYLTDAAHGGTATHIFRYGSGGDELVVGDWNGDARDTFGVRRGNEFYLTNREGGTAQVVAKFGSPGDIVIVGDWNGDKKDSLGVRRGNEYHLANSVVGGRTDVVNTYGTAQDTSLVGDWNGDGIDTMAVRRSYGPPRTYSGSDTYAVGSNFVPGLYRGSAQNTTCYWERVSDFSGQSSSITANAFWSAPAVPLYVEVKSTDAGFASEGCGTWSEARDTDPVRYLTIDDGEYRVGKDMAAGTYTAPGGDSCYWEAVSSFDHEFASLLGNDFGAPNPIVDVTGSFGFVSSDCGTWTRVSDAAASKATKNPPNRFAFDQQRVAATMFRE